MREHGFVVGDRVVVDVAPPSSGGVGAERARDRAVVVVPGVGHGATSSARSAARNFCMPMRMRYFTVPSGFAELARDLAVREPVEVGHLDRDALRARAASASAARTACSTFVGLEQHARDRRAGSVGWRSSSGVPAAQRLLRSHPLDRAAVRHREEERAERAAAHVETLGLLPEPHEHVLHDLLGQRLVREHAQREAVHRGRVRRGTPRAALLRRRRRVARPARGSSAGFLRAQHAGNCTRRPAAAGSVPEPSTNRGDLAGRMRVRGYALGRPGPAEGWERCIHAHDPIPASESDWNRVPTTRSRERSDPREWPPMRITFLGHAGCFVRDRVTARCCATRGSRPAYFGSWFPFPRNDGLDPGDVRAHPTTSTSRTCTAITSIPSGSPRHVHKQARVLLPEFGIDLLARELRSLGFHDFVRTRHGERDRPRRARRHDPRDDLAGRRSARRLRDRARRRHRPRPQPERRPPRRPRRAARARPVRRAAAAVLGRDLVPDRLRLPARGEGTSRPRRSAIDEMERARALRRGGRRRARVPVRRAAVLPRPRPLPRSTTSTAIPANIFPDQTVFLDQLAAHGIDTRDLIVPGSIDRARGGRVHGDASGRRPTVQPPVRRQARVPRRSTARDWSAWLAAEHAVVAARPGTTSSPSSRRGSSRCSSRRRSRRPGIAGNVVHRRRRSRRRRVHRLRRVGRCGGGRASRTSTRSTSTAR